MSHRTTACRRGACRRTTQSRRQRRQVDRRRADTRTFERQSSKSIVTFAVSGPAGRLGSRSRSDATHSSVPLLVLRDMLGQRYCVSTDATFERAFGRPVSRRTGSASRTGQCRGGTRSSSSIRRTPTLTKLCWCRCGQGARASGSAGKAIVLHATAPWPLTGQRSAPRRTRPTACASKRLPR